jgi:hypothetical protein
MIIKQPSERGLAQLLNLTLEDYKKLKHAPLIPDINGMGAVIGYFMHISPNNDADLLKKIILTKKSNFVWFSVSQVSLVYNL